MNDTGDHLDFNPPTNNALAAKGTPPGSEQNQFVRTAQKSTLYRII
jgi:hypothetical protein